MAIGATGAMQITLALALAVTEAYELAAAGLAFAVTARGARLVGLAVIVAATLSGGRRRAGAGVSARRS